MGKWLDSKLPDGLVLLRRRGCSKRREGLTPPNQRKWESGPLIVLPQFETNVKSWQFVRGGMGKGYIRLLIGFHIHTWKHAHTHFLTHVWSIDFWPLCTCGSEFKWDLTLLSSLSQCSLGEHVHYVLQWVSSNDAFLEMIFIFSRLCETAVHHCVCIAFSPMWMSRPRCASTAEEEWVLEKDQNRKRKAIECVMSYMKSTLWGGGIEEHVFPNAPFTQKHIHLHLLCGLACITFFVFSIVLKMLKAFESQTDFSRICTFLCISFLHYKMELHIIIPCYCMKQLSINYNVQYI